MKKLLIGLFFLVVVCAGIAAVPYWFGLQAKAIYDQHLEQLEQDNEILVERGPYRAGWLSSRALETITFPGSNVQFEVISEIEHGPFPISQLVKRISQLSMLQALVHFDVTPKFGNNYSKSLGNLINVAAEVDFNGRVDGSARLSAGRHRVDGQTLVKWKGGSGTFSIEPRGASSNGVITIPTLQIESPDGSANLKKISAKINFSEHPLGLPVGKTIIDIASVSAADSNGSSQKIQLSGLKLTSVTAVSKRLVDYRLDLKIKQMIVLDDTYGPGELSLKLAGLDAKSVAKISSNAVAANRKGNQNSMPVAMGFLDTLSKSKPELETRLYVDSPQGVLQGKAVVNVDMPEEAGEQNPFAIIGGIKARAGLIVPEKLLINLTALQVRGELNTLKSQGKIPELSEDKYNQVVNQAVAARLQRYIRENTFTSSSPGEYQVKAKFENGTLTVNNKPVELMGAM